SFSIASIIGVPAGLYLANLYNWAMPFYVLSAISMMILFLGYKVLPKINSHRENVSPKKILQTMEGVFQNPNHLIAFTFMIFMMFAGFSVIPFISPFMVFNVGLTKEQLPYIYFFGGLFTFFTSQYIGRLSDKFGKPKVFRIVAAFSIIPLILITNLPRIELVYAVLITTIFMILISGRFVPAIAMINSSADPGYRGSFMSINSSLQQLASGGASMTAGIIVTSAKDGSLQNYNLVGALAVVSTILCIFLSTKMKPAIHNR
ncbi:MAG: MFS transporter, partial [Leptospira sp.]|nr:MFS transporter [Leptospira sp.]